MYKIRDRQYSTLGTTIPYVPGKQYLCNVIQDRVTLTIPSARRGV